METECTKAMLKAAEDAQHLREQLATAATRATPVEKIVVQVEKEVENSVLCIYVLLKRVSRLTRFLRWKRWST